MKPGCVHFLQPCSNLTCLCDLKPDLDVHSLHVKLKMEIKDEISGGIYVLYIKWHLGIYRVQQGLYPCRAVWVWEEGMSLCCLQPFRCTDNSRLDICESDFRAAAAAAPSVTSWYPLLFRCCGVHLIFHYRTTVSALTHLCQIKSDHPCCLRYSIFAVDRLLFNFRLCLKQWRKRQGKQRENHGIKSRDVNFAAAGVVIWVNANSKWDDTLAYDVMEAAGHHHLLVEITAWL